MAGTWSDEQAAAFAQDGFVVVEDYVTPAALDALREHFARVFGGDYETGVEPDLARPPAGATGQVANAWKADRTIAAQVLAERTGRLAAALGDWSGTRLAQDNCLWKAPRSGAIAMHRDAGGIGALDPPEMITCWVPLDDTRADAGTLVYVRGSHRWPQRHETFVFHTDDDWLAPARAAAPDGVELDLVPVVVRAGGAAFHHHATLHGSAPNASDRERRSVVSHLVAADTEIVEDGVRRRLSDRNYPLLWHASAP